MKNVHLAVDVVNHIQAHPETWDQEVPHHWKTTHCFAGHVQIMGSRAQDIHTCLQDMTELLECSKEDAAWLTYSGRTLGELHAYAKSYADGVPYFDAEGYNRHGYGRDGYNREGYDCHGYDREGYDCYGYARSCYDRHGYDRDGYDREGHLHTTHLERITVWSIYE